MDQKRKKKKVDHKLFVNLNTVGCSSSVLVRNIEHYSLIGKPHDGTIFIPHLMVIARLARSEPQWTEWLPYLLQRHLWANEKARVLILRGSVNEVLNPNFGACINAYAGC